MTITFDHSFGSWVPNLIYLTLTKKKYKDRSCPTSSRATKVTEMSVNNSVYTMDVLRELDDMFQNGATFNSRKVHTLKKVFRLP